MATELHTFCASTITLRNIRQPMWRQIEVANETKPSELARMREAAMGWLGGHLTSSGRVVCSTT